MGHEIYMVDPRLPIDNEKREAINRALRDDPRLKPVPFIFEFLGGKFDIRVVARYVITSDRLATRGIVEHAVAQSFHRFVSTIIPGLNNPLSYTVEQAQRICELERSLRITPHDAKYSIRFLNPLTRHMSLRQLRNETGVSSRNIEKDITSGFALGSLWLYCMITSPDHNPIKKAIHDSVHGSRGGGATLVENVIGINADRITNDRRMISITLRMI